MSTLQQPPATPRKKLGVEYVEYDKYIDRQVERTRRAVKLIDLTQAVLVLVIGVVGFLFTAAVIEHWIFTGGLGSLGRFALFVVMAGSLGYYVVRYVWPLVTSTINPAYAAAAIEREHPGLKNSLLNFLMFRTHKKEMPAAVYEALEQQAAQRLSQTSIEDSIDRSALVKLGYVLLAVVVFATLYAMLSPKSSLTTAARVLMPWANIAAPSRVRIDDIQPGDVEIVEGDKVEITAQVTGLSEGELVEVSYDTADGHRVDQRVAMQAANNAGKYIVTLPPPGDLSGLSGIDQDLRYRITAGDGRTIDYNIQVLTAPSIRVEHVHFDFPDYTGYADVTIDGRGDIRALEGTKVTIDALANTDIEAAFLDLASDGRNDARMKHEGSKARVDVDLRLDDRRAIKTTSYMLRYTSTEGLANNQPPQHSLEIVPDYAPEVNVLAPEERARDVQMNETIPISVDALDPDFALRTVTLKFAKEDGTAVHDELLLDRKHGMRFVTDWNFTPQELKLQPGDIVEYWAEATDIRTPQANRSTSDRKQFRIVGDPKQGQGERGEGAGQPQRGENGEQGQEGEDGQQGENGDQGQQGEAGEQGKNGEQGVQGQEGSEQGQQGGEQGQGNEQGENAQNGEGQGDQQGAGAAGEQQQGGEGMNEGQQQGAGGAAGEQPPEGESEDGAGGEQGQNGASGNQQNSGEQGSQQGDNAQGGDQQSGEGNQGGEQNSRPVANDGSDDTTAFERIQRQLSQDEQQNATRQQKEGSADPNGKMEQGDAQDAAQREQGKQGESQGEKNREGSGSEGNPKPSQGDPQGQGEKAGNKEAGKEGRQSEGQKPDGQEGSAAEREAQGAGADAKTDAPQSEGGKPNESQPDAGSKSAGGEERNASGEEGAGEDTEAQGAPDAQEEMQERGKTPDKSEGGNENESEPPTPGHSKHESDSRGEQGGDRAGGGEEGGGQKAPREGTGSAGQNQAADEGAGKSADQGPGETGTRAGDSQKAEGETGQSGDEKGNGSESRQGQGEQQGQGQPKGNEQQQNPQASGSREASGEQREASGEQQQGMQQGNEAEGEQANQGKPGEKGQPGENEQQQNQPQNKQETNQNANNPSAQGGQPGGNDGTMPGQPQGQFDGTVAEGDEANLEYARKQTNMVLEKLADQLDKNEVDQEMLDELGWSEEDLRQFVDRWNRLRAAAEKPNATQAKQELDARLRSLGGSLGIKGGTTERTEDDFRDLSEGYQSKVPLKYRDRLKAYTEGVSRGTEAGER